MIETVYKGTNDPNSIRVFKADGSPFDFSLVDRMTLSISGMGVVADADSESSLIKWQGGEEGEIIFNLNELNIAHGQKLYATLRVFDPGHPKGQVLINGAGVETIVPRDPERVLELWFIDPDA
ncbi:hypothetical protein HBA55_34915 [Pseudomaricurvus alkylphenolicus]|uniref:hypothetical protein n=1 Tax=Pseudomaricurvus alkylphenolicus TaxID=1306991 RepID=UPI00142037C2|nr:hypothetical protein [Pseudomaricurvus alkylphenolicus]NIB44825.1 hypothetical protein [Pseudomaricurvus alkylphenolicus]